jgi:hypothetical protein
MDSDVTSINFTKCFGNMIFGNMITDKIKYNGKRITNIKLIVSDLEEEQINEFLFSHMLICWTDGKNYYSNMIRVIDILLINKIFFNKICNDDSQIEFHIFDTFNMFSINNFIFFNTVNIQLQFERTNELLEYNNNITPNLCCFLNWNGFCYVIDVSNFDEVNDCTIKFINGTSISVRFRIINVRNFKFLLFSSCDIDLYNLNTLLKKYRTQWTITLRRKRDFSY